MKSYIKLIEKQNKRNIRVSELNGVYWVSLKTRGLEISAFWNEREEFGKIEFNSQYWRRNDGSEELDAEVWTNILSNCIDLMDF